MAQSNEKIVITDVPANKVEFYRKWCESMGGKFISVEQEPDGEFTIVITFPKTS